MLQSMTGFAAIKGQFESYSWSIDLRSVNAKGLDLRLRVPDWIDGLEPAIRAVMAKSLSRGAISLSLRVSKEEEQGALDLNKGQISAVLEALRGIEEIAGDMGVHLAPSKASDLLSIRGVLETSADKDDSKALAKAIVAQIPNLIDELQKMRRAEGQALDEVLLKQLSLVENLTKQAGVAAESRREETTAIFKANLARVLENTEGADANRVAQELAIIAVKTDIMEELDRLFAHVGAARDLIAAGSPAGRKLDFLMQEFNREANTLCSKAQSVELTRIGLDLKAVIDQMREQVQNVE